MGRPPGSSGITSDVCRASMTRGSNWRIPDVSFRWFVSAALLATVGDAAGCAEAEIRTATARIDDLNEYEDVALFVRPRLLLIVDAVEYDLSRSAYLRLIDIVQPPRSPIQTRMLWVSFREDCYEPECALGFLRNDDGYALSLVPEKTEAYRGTKTKANRLHVTIGQPARTRSGKRLRLTCRELDFLNVIHRPGKPPGPRCPRR